MSVSALRWQMIGGYLTIALGLVTWPLVQLIISSGGHPMVIIGIWIVLLLIIGYLLFMRRK
jgi:uncharacterized membrane protein YedE/YeeE